MKGQRCYRSTSDTVGQLVYCYSTVPGNYFHVYNGDYYYPCHHSCAGCYYHATSCSSCRDGFYRKEGDASSCYSELPGYYLEGNIFKKCDSSCETCFNSTNKNCITCKNDYYFTEDNHSCVNKNSTDYFLDLENNILRKCHPNCLKCNSSYINETHMNCISCKENYYMTEDTQSCYQGEINNYYLNYSEEPWEYKRCHPNCLTCNSSYINETHMNCLTCQNNYYITEDTNSCYYNLIDNYYFDFDNKILRRCHPNCLRCISSPINNTYMNCLVCQNGYFITEDTNSCYNFKIDNYYIDNTSLMLRRCHKNCYLCSDARIV